MLKYPRKKRPLLSLILSALVMLTFPSYSKAEVFKEKTSVMGTDLEITVSTDSKEKAQKAFDTVVSEMKKIEDEMSEWKEGTYVSEINKYAGKKAVAVPDDLFKVIWASLVVSDLSGGAFDITWASMRGVWDFRRGHERVPSPEEVREKLKLVDYRDIVLDEKKKTVFLKREGMAIGLGAIAKGYAVDRATLAIAKEGIKDSIVKAGGDMRVQGTDNGAPWEIGIKHPRKKELLAKLRLSNVSISTSGDYERFFIKDNVLYHHIMDPKTGYPARASMSVTILAPDTMTSDALSTAVFVMGPDRGLELVGRLKGVEAIIVDSNGKMRISPGINLK